jgi:hypothetical protein
MRGVLLQKCLQSSLRGFRVGDFQVPFSAFVNEAHRKRKIASARDPEVKE